MKTTKKALLLAFCAVLLVVSTVLATMAFLTDSDSVQNTFTFGRVGISLDEADVNDADGDGNTEERVQANEYHLIPGREYTKDPTVHVDADSEDCWLFVKLENGLKDIIDGKATVEDGDADDTVYTLEAQMEKNGWTLIDEGKGVWAYELKASKSADVKVFDEFKLIDNADVADYVTLKDDNGKVIGGKTIDITAYAIQADGFDTYTDAWTAAPADWSL